MDGTELDNPWVFAQDGEDLFIASEDDVKNWEGGDKNFPAQMYSPEDKHFSEVKPFQVWMKFLYGVELVTPYPFDTEKAAKFYSSRQRRWFFATMGRPGGVQVVRGQRVIPVALNRPALATPGSGKEFRKKLDLLDKRKEKELEVLREQKIALWDKKYELRQAEDQASERIDRANNAYYAAIDNQAYDSAITDDVVRERRRDLRQAERDYRAVQESISTTEDEVAEINNKIFDLDEKYRQQAHELLKTKNPTTIEDIDLYVDNAFLGHQADMIRADVRTALSMIDQSALGPLNEFYGSPAPGRRVRVDVKVNNNPATRSHFDPSVHNINLDLGHVARRYVTVHEMGHWLEAKNPALAKKGVDFRKRRTAGEQLTHLGPGYDANEYAYRDKFKDHYVGKDYGTDAHSEVISMGMQYLFQDPLTFARDDPDYFDFMFDTLRGK